LSTKKICPSAKEMETDTKGDKERICAPSGGAAKRGSYRARFPRGGEQKKRTAGPEKKGPGGVGGGADEGTILAPVRTSHVRLDKYKKFLKWSQ